MVYAHIHMTLCRPFLHHLVPHLRGAQPSRDLQTYASAGVESACNIVRLGNDMRRNDLLYGAQWRVIHMIFNASMTLLYVIHGCRKGSGPADVAMVGRLMQELDVAKELLMHLWPYSYQAKRSHTALTVSILSSFQRR